MSERKVLSKYYPPDFDPSKIGRTKGPKQVGPKQITVRLMAPFSMRCTACGEFIYKGRKCEFTIPILSAGAIANRANSQLEEGNR
jgi:hypothetical protein